MDVFTGLNNAKGVESIAGLPSTPVTAGKWWKLGPPATCFYTVSKVLRETKGLHAVVGYMANGDNAVLHAWVRKGNRHYEVVDVPQRQYLAVLDLTPSDYNLWLLAVHL